MIKDDRKTSKFRNLYGQGAVRKTEMYEGIRVSQHQTESCPVAVNPKWMAVSIQSEGGGTFVTLPIYQKGRVDDLRLPHFHGHSKPVVELSWNPFDDDVIATGSEDAVINIWNVGNPHLDAHHYSDTKTSLLLSLKRHDKRINCLSWHPSASNILASAASDSRAIIWNVETGQAFKTIVDFKDAVWDVAWNYTGSLLAATSKDKILRIIDPRRGSIVKEARSHQGVKSSKVFFVDKDPYGVEQHYIITTGFSKMSERQIAVWDQRKMREPLSLDMIDSSPGALYPFFDQETGILYVGGKGDGSIKFYEFRAASVSPLYSTHYTIHSSQSGSSEYYSDSEENRKRTSSKFEKSRNRRSPSHQIDQEHLLTFLGSFQTSIPQTGLCSMPKRGLDTSICEVYRFYKLRASATATNNVTIIEPISMIVPRKSTVYQEDLYPPTSSIRPALQASEWISGRNSAPLLVSLKNFAGVYTDEPPPKPGQKPMSQLGVLKSKFLMRQEPLPLSYPIEEEAEEDQGDDVDESTMPTSVSVPSIPETMARNKQRLNENKYGKRDNKTVYPSKDKRSAKSTDRRGVFEGSSSEEGGSFNESQPESEDYEETISARDADEIYSNISRSEDGIAPNIFGSNDRNSDKIHLNFKNNAYPETDEQIREDMRKLREKKLKAYHDHKVRAQARESSEREKDGNLKEVESTYKADENTSIAPPVTSEVAGQKRIATIPPRQREESRTSQDISSSGRQQTVTPSSGNRSEHAPFFMSMSSSRPKSSKTTRTSLPNEPIQILGVSASTFRSTPSATLARPEDSQTPPAVSSSDEPSVSSSPEPTSSLLLSPAKSKYADGTSPTSSKVDKFKAGNASLPPPRPPKMSSNLQSPRIQNVNEHSSPFAHKRASPSSDGKKKALPFLKQNLTQRSLDIPSLYDEDEQYFSDYKDYHSMSKTTANNAPNTLNNIRRQNSFTRNDNYKAFFEAANSQGTVSNRKKNFELNVNNANNASGNLSTMTTRSPTFHPSKIKREETLKPSTTAKGQRENINFPYDINQLGTPLSTPKVKAVTGNQQSDRRSSDQQGYSLNQPTPPTPPLRQPQQTNNTNYKVSYAAVPPIVVNTSCPAYSRKNLVSTLLSHEGSQTPINRSNPITTIATATSSTQLQRGTEQLQPRQLQNYPLSTSASTSSHFTQVGQHQYPVSSNAYGPSSQASKYQNTNYIDETLAICNQLREENRIYRTEIGFKNRRIVELENEVSDKNRKIKDLEIELGLDRMQNTFRKHQNTPQPKIFPISHQPTYPPSSSQSSQVASAREIFKNSELAHHQEFSKLPARNYSNVFPTRLTSLTSEPGKGIGSGHPDASKGDSFTAKAVPSFLTAQKGSHNVPTPPTRHPFSPPDRKDREERHMEKPKYILTPLRK